MGVAGVVIAGLVLSVIGGVVLHRAHNSRVPLLTSGVGVNGAGDVVGIPPAGPGTFVANTRVLASGEASVPELVAQQQAWLAAGRIPGSGGRYASLALSALLDLRMLVQPNGAALASWPGPWHYVWPRDASMVAVALAATGHTNDAMAVLAFLQSQQPADGIFQARYQPDGSGPPDARGAQVDGIGWTLWATAEVLKHVSVTDRPGFLARLRPLVERGTAAAMRLTDRPDALPAPSADYWEVPESRLTLSTAALLATGLRAAATLETDLGDADQAGLALSQATRVAEAIRRTFGAEGYPRHLGEHDADAAIAFLLPPFADSADVAVVAALEKEMSRSRRAAGGYAPGSSWKHDGISWTPETALFALVLAEHGDYQQATTLLDWLNTHRTSTGSLPEKVLSNGQPAGPAPLSWTSATVILAIDALSPASSA